VTSAQALRTRQIHWSWHGQTVTLGLDEAGEGPPILLLPALSSISTRREMHPLLQHLAPHGRVIAPDWPGFGDQPRPAITWTPDALSAFLDHLVKNELPSLHATVAAGHAASYALRFAERHPGTLGRLALLAPTWRGPLPTMAGGHRPLFAAIRRAIGMPVVGPLLYLANVNRFVVSMMVAGHVYSAKDALTGDRLRQKCAVIHAPNARYGSAAFVTGGLDCIESREEFLELAQRAGSPILVMCGAGTPPKSRAEMEALAQLGAVRSVTAPRGKLGFYEEFADDLTPALLSFLLDRDPL
jgi:pimeloyl-ACP methyl ester carboxylesterase